MPQARLRVEPQRAGAISAAMTVLKPDWKKVWHEAARPRCCGKGSSASSVRLGMASDMPKVYTKMGSTLHGSPAAARG
jgi:hypothetical protein